MRTNNNSAADVQGLAAKSKEKKVKIELMHDFMAHIASLLRYNGRSAYSHSVKVPTELLEGIDELSCTLDYPLEEPHTFNIPLDKSVFGNVTLIDVDSLCMAVAKEYAMLKRVKGFVFHVLSDLWIEGMKIQGKELVVYIGS